MSTYRKTTSSSKGRKHQGLKSKVRCQYNLQMYWQHLISYLHQSDKSWDWTHSIWVPWDEGGFPAQRPSHMRWWSAYQWQSRSWACPATLHPGPSRKPVQTCRNGMPDAGSRMPRLDQEHSKCHRVYRLTECEDNRDWSHTFWFSRG